MHLVRSKIKHFKPANWGCKLLRVNYKRSMHVIGNMHAPISRVRLISRVCGIYLSNSRVTSILLPTCDLN